MHLSWIQSGRENRVEPLSVEMKGRWTVARLKKGDAVAAMVIKQSTCA
jgi:hypothetical protein